MVICRTLGANRTASVARIELVVTIISIGDDAMRATAPPDNTPCVTYALVDRAPALISASAALQ